METLERRVELLWIPELIKFKSNETTDDLASLGAEKPPMIVESNVRVSYTQIKAYF